MKKCSEPYERSLDMLTNYVNALHAPSRMVSYKFGFRQCTFAHSTSIEFNSLNFWSDALMRRQDPRQINSTGTCSNYMIFSFSHFLCIFRDKIIINGLCTMISPSLFRSLLRSLYRSLFGIYQLTLLQIERLPSTCRDWNLSTTLPKRQIQTKNSIEAPSAEKKQFELFRLLRAPLTISIAHTHTLQPLHYGMSHCDCATEIPSDISICFAPETASKWITKRAGQKNTYNRQWKK